MRNGARTHGKMPNPAVKRTYPGVAALRSHRAPSAPVYAAYLALGLSECKHATWEAPGRQA